MRILEESWRELEAEPSRSGTTSLRLFPHSGHDIFLAVQQPGGRRMLVIRVPRAAAEAFTRRQRTLPSARGISLGFAAGNDGTQELQITLTAPDRRAVFNPLITDIASAAQVASDAEAALLAATARFGHWQRLLQTIADTGLGPERRRGLYGELNFLLRHLLPVLNPAESVEAWTGPTGTHQDFQLLRTAVEVKAGVVKAPVTLAIASERQLDDTGVDNLFLAHVAVDERRGGTGVSLNSLIDTIRDRIAGPARLTFDDLLLTAGYLEEHRRHYDEPRYTERNLAIWRVTGAFPRITPAALPHGVGDCRYRISTAGLDPYRVDPDEFAKHLKGQL